MIVRTNDRTNDRPDIHGQGSEFTYYNFSWTQKKNLKKKRILRRMIPEMIQF